MRRICITMMALGLTACTSSGVAMVGSDTYKVTNTAITSFGGAASAKGGAYRRATQHCAAQSKRAVVVDDSTQATIASGSADVVFKCEP